MLEKLKTEALDPVLWGNLKEVLEKLLPRRRILHVYEEQGSIRAVDDAGTRFSIDSAVAGKAGMELSTGAIGQGKAGTGLPTGAIGSANAETGLSDRLTGAIAPREPEMLEKLLEAYPEMDEIRYYTKEGLDHYDRALQEQSIFAMGIDQYLGFQYELLSKTEGIRVVRKSDGPNTIFDYLHRWIRTDGVYGFWVDRDGACFFNAVLVVEDGDIVLLTTSDRYGLQPLTAEGLKQAVELEFGGLTDFVVKDYAQLGTVQK